MKRTLIKLLNGRRCVPAWPWEKGAFEHAGDWWRPLGENE